MNAKPIGILGGTFDPIHFGHLHLARRARQLAQLQEVRLIPLNTAPHRNQPLASGAHRLAMLTLAVAEEPGLVADDLELRHHEISYTLSTLVRLRREFPRTPLCLILGIDAFAGLPGWYEWRQLFTLSHILVASRHTFAADFNDALADEIALRQTTAIKDLHCQPGGRIYFCEIAALAISATDIRTRRRQGLPLDHLIPAAVQQYIEEHKLYA